MSTGSFSIYNGRALLGSITERLDGKAEAFGADGRSLGVFSSRKAALAAIPAGVDLVVTRPSRVDPASREAGR